MAYTTVAQVKSMFRSLKIESANTAVITSEVDGWISAQDAIIDAKLGSYYETPITGTESLKIIELISRYKVAHIIKTVLELSQPNSDKTQEGQTNLDEKANEMIADLLPTKGSKGEYIRPVMPLSDASKKSMAPATASITAYNSDNEPTFTKGGDNW